MILSIFLMPLSELLLLSGMAGGLLGCFPIALPGILAGLGASGILEMFLVMGEDAENTARVFMDCRAA